MKKQEPVSVEDAEDVNYVFKEHPDPNVFTNLPKQMFHWTKEERKAFRKDTEVTLELLKEFTEDKIMRVKP